MRESCSGFEDAVLVLYTAIQRIATRPSLQWKNQTPVFVHGCVNGKQTVLFSSERVARCLGRFAQLHFKLFALKLKKCLALQKRIPPLLIPTCQD